MSENLLNSKNLLDSVTARITQVYEDAEAKEIAFLLLEHLFSLTKTDIILQKKVAISPAVSSRLDSFVERLLNNEPVQYILGVTWFYNRKFNVNTDVLIPRPETEELVDSILKDILTKNAPLSIVDFCTGSGCIAITLKKELPHSEVSAYDISGKALELARTNAIQNDAVVNFIQQDILKEFPISTPCDIIVSNPPYVCENEKSEMRKNVLDFEPHIALFVSDNDPLVFYKRIIELGKQLLKKEGKIYFEINQKLGNGVVELAKENGYTHAEVLKDFRGNERFVRITL